MKIGAIIILYNPNLDILFRNVEILLNDCNVILINNGQKIGIDLDNPHIFYKEFGYNRGIAFALNYGIEYCIKNKYDYLITLDQDSCIPNHLIKQLLHSYSELYSHDKRNVAISPIHINLDNNYPYKYKSINCLKEYVEVRELLTSGMFIKVSIFEEIGLMNEKLFIDGVDSEWCWRARYIFGKRVYMDTRIKMYHKLGEGDRSIFGRKIAIATPFRCYYQYRNFIILSTFNYTPKSWIIKNGIKYIIRLIYYPIFVKPRWKYLICSLKGIYSGVKYIFTHQYY